MLELVVLLFCSLTSANYGQTMCTGCEKVFHEPYYSSRDLKIREVTTRSRWGKIKLSHFLIIIEITDALSKPALAPRLQLVPPPFLCAPHINLGPGSFNSQLLS